MNKVGWAKRGSNARCMPHDSAARAHASAMHFAKEPHGHGAHRTIPYATFVVPRAPLPTLQFADEVTG
jgi:hypothetical protein